MRPLTFLALLLAACNGPDVDTDTGNDTDDDTGTETGTDIDTETTGSLNVYAYSSSACASSETVLAGTPASEDGHWTAVGLSPDEDMNVTRVSISLFNGTSEASNTACDASLASTVDLYVTDGSAPPNNATPDDTIAVPTENVPGNERILNLATNLDVASNETLWVTLKMTATTGASTCVRTCNDNTHDDDNFWSNASEQPYAWSAFPSIGLSGTTQFFSAHGEAL